MKQWGICCLGWATLKGFLPFCLLCNFAEEVLLLLEFGSVESSQWQGYSLKRASNQGFLPLDPAGMGLEQPKLDDCPFVGGVYWELRDPTCEYLLQRCFLRHKASSQTAQNCWTQRGSSSEVFCSAFLLAKNSDIWGQFRSEVPALDSKYLSWGLTCLGDSTWIFLSLYFPWRIWNNHSHTWDTELGWDYSRIFLPFLEICLLCHSCHNVKLTFNSSFRGNWFWR